MRRRAPGLRPFRMLSWPPFVHGWVRVLTTPASRTSLVVATRYVVTGGSAKRFGSGLTLQSFESVFPPSDPWPQLADAPLPWAMQLPWASFFRLESCELLSWL